MFPGGSDGKAAVYNAGDLGSIPGSRSPGEGNGTPLQYSCLENPMDGGAWWAAVHGVAKSRTRLSDFTFTFHFSFSCIGEGNGNPLQCSCLGNLQGQGSLVDCRLWSRTELDTTEAAAMLIICSLVAQMVKRLSTMCETQVQSLGQEDLLEEEMATHYSILA